MVSQNCRFCNFELNETFTDLGDSPLANSYLKESDFDKETFYPLCTFLCKNCFLVQLEELETPENIFSNYAYFSSFSWSNTGFQWFSISFCATSNGFSNIKI